MSDGIGDPFAPSAPADPAAGIRHDPGFQQALEGGQGWAAQQRAGARVAAAFQAAYPEEPAADVDHHQGQHAHTTGALSVPTTVDGYSFPDGWADGAPDLAEAMGAWGVSARISVETMSGVAREIDRLSERSAEPTDAILEAQARDMQANLGATPSARATLQRARARWQAMERVRPDLAKALHSAGAAVDEQFVRTLGR